MGIIKAFAGAIGGTLGDQWKDIVTAAAFDEYVVVSPGVLKRFDNGRGTNSHGSFAVLTNGSKIYVPENTVAYIFNQSGIEEIITEPGGYEYRNGEDSIFDDAGLGAVWGQIKERVGYGGISPQQKKIAFVNLREIRNIRFGTKGAQIYNDKFYECDLYVFAFGTFTIKVVDSVKFIKEFVPPNVAYYSFEDNQLYNQITSELLQSFNDALNTLSADYRVSQLPSQADEIVKLINADEKNAGTWKDRFGFEVVSIAIENIELSDDSKALIKEYSMNKINVKAYEDITKKAADIAAQQKISEGIKENGLGDMGGMILGMNIAQGLSVNAGEKNPQKVLKLDDQIEALKKLKTLLDEGVLTNEEFEIMKKETLGL